MSKNQVDINCNVDAITHEVVEQADTTESALIDSKIPVAVDSNASDSTVAGTPIGVEMSKDRPWDFSNRKVIVQGVDKFHDVKTATKMVQKWLEIKPEVQDQFSIDKIKKPPKSTWMTITLQSESMVQPFIDYINSNSIRNRKGNNIFAKLQTNSVDHDSEHKRARSENEGDGAMVDPCGTNETHSKRSRREGSANKDDDTSLARRPIHVDELKDRIIPLWKLSPEEQLQYKMKEMIKKCAMKIVNEIKSKFRSLEKEKSRTKVEVYPWILQQRCIDVQPIVTAPTPLRNKCEFTFGYQYLLPSSMDDGSTHISMVGADSLPDFEDRTGGSNGTDRIDSAESKFSKVPAVGFMVTGWAGGVAFSDSLPNIPSEATAIVEIINSFLLTSQLAPYDCTNHCGFWRILTVRVSRRTQECMVIIQHNSPTSPNTGFNPDSINVTLKEGFSQSPVTSIFASEREKLIAMLTEADLPSVSAHSSIKVTSIFFQEFSGLSNPSPEHPVQHAYGKECLTERLGCCLFQISPGAFFQVNTEGAEILYQLVVDKIREIAPDPARTLLFDVCCGTGTIGLTCLKAGVVGRVVGVDISEPAIMDAKRNASLNGYSTELSDGSIHPEDASVTRFVASRAELVLGREIQRVKQLQRRSDGTADTLQFVAVVDPAREGLHADVIKAIRSNNQICHLVYVSCNPTATLVRDAALLCSPATKRYTGRPFRIVAANPVDMFPLTNHCEMVMTFHRLSDNEMEMKGVGQGETHDR